jgi:hypothetical protein
VAVSADVKYLIEQLCEVITQHCVVEMTSEVSPEDIERVFQVFEACFLRTCISNFYDHQIPAKSRNIRGQLQGAYECGPIISDFLRKT